MNRLIIASVFALTLTDATLAQTPVETTPSVYKLTNESELGFIQVKGNTESQSISAKQLSTYSWEKNKVDFNARHLRTTSSGNETGRSWEFGLRYERALAERFSGFAGQKYENDIFAGIEQRLSSDLGGKYFFYKTEPMKWFVEAGYRYVDEEKTSGAKDSYNAARLYSEIENVWREGLSTKLWAEYIPNFDDSEDYNANAEASVAVALSKVFSLKTSYLVKYDNVPSGAGLQRTDTTLTTSVIAKF